MRGESYRICVQAYRYRYLFEIKKRMQGSLAIGSWYKIPKRKQQDQDERKWDIVERKMRLVKKYQHFALFETVEGIRECYLYQDLYSMLQSRV